jgi:hypothetical protein
MAFGTVKARMSARAVSRWAATWQFVGQRVDDAVELGVHRLGVGLVIDAVQQRLDPAPLRLRRRGHEVGRVVSTAPLPAGSGQRGADGIDQATVRVTGDQPHPGQAAGDQVAEERQPAGAVLGAADLQAEDLP